MKKLLFVLILFSSCVSNNQQKAEDLVQSYISFHSVYPYSYESLKFSKLKKNIYEKKTGATITMWEIRNIYYTDKSHGVRELDTAYFRLDSSLTTVLSKH